MSVSVTNGSLDFVSTLDNSDFQAKSLQDIKLIELRLQLTGDTSGVTKYDEAVKAALDTETKLRADLAKILEDAQIQTQQFIRTVQQSPSKTVFSDSVTEAQAYADSLLILGDTGNVALSGVDALLEQFNADFAAGKITIDEYSEAINAMAEAQDVFNQQLSAASAPLEEELGILENLKASLIELKATNLTIIDPEELAASNARLQELEAEISRMTNIGKIGFDEFGVKIVQTNTEVEETIGLIGTLQAELAELKGSRINIIDPAQLAQTNAQIEEMQVKLAQLNNVGKEGFNQLGDALPVEKIGKFEAAIARSTDLSTIGGRVITQFTRQIVSLGVGFLSLEIGAKAIESLIEYISNLDAFTGRLDVAKQTLDAFKASELEADKTASSQIANLEILYDKTQDVTKSIQERFQAAEALRTQFPSEFANTSALAIVNGQAANSYRDLASSILQVAESQAASAKITEAAGKILDAQTAIADAKRERDLELQRASLLSDQASEGASAAAAGGNVSPRQAAIDQANYAYNAVLEKNSGTVTTQTQVVKNLEQYVTEVSSATKKLKDANVLLGNELQNFNNLISGAGKFTNKQQLDNIQSALQTVVDNPIGQTQAKIDQAKADLKKVDDLEKQFQVKPTTIDPFISRGQTELAGQTTLLENIEALKQKYAAKDADKETQNLAEIQSNFSKQYDAVVAYNVKRQAFIDAYNRAHKNTGGEAYATSIGYNAQDPSTLIPANNLAISTQADLNENAYIQQDIDKKKKLYADYQAYRLKVGDNIANADYADLLKSGDDFQTYLTNIQSSIDKTDTSGPIVQRAAIVKKALDENAEAQKVALQSLNEQYVTFETSREALIGAAQAKITLLIRNGESDQALIVANELKATLETQDAQQAQRIQSATQFTSSLLDLTKQQAKNALDAAQAENDLLYAQGKITVEVYNAVNAAIKQGRSELNSNQTANYLGDIGGALSGLSSEISQVNSGFGSMIATLGSTLTTFKSLSDLQVKIKANGGLLNSLMGADPKDAISEITDGLQAVLTIVSSITSASAARKKAAEDYYNEVLTFQQQYNVALDEQARLQYQTQEGSIFGDNAAQQLADGAAAYNAASAQYTASLTALQQGQAITGTKASIDAGAVVKDAAAGAVIGSIIPGFGTTVGAVVGGIVGGLVGLFGAKKPTNVLAPLLSTYPDLIEANGQFNESLAKTLVANNLVSDSTKTLLNNTIAYYDEEKTALDQIDSALQSLVGDLGSQLSDALTSAFENGQDAALAFQNTVSGVLNNIIQQDLFQAIFGSQLALLQKTLESDALTGGANSQAEIIAAIEQFYQTAGASVSEFTAGLQAAQAAGAASGIPLFQPTSGGGSSLSGQIQANVTEATADILAGALNGIQLNTLTISTILQGHTLTFGQLLSLAQDQLNSILLIQTNTKVSADNSVLMTQALDAIAQNTKSSIGDQLRAAGQLGF
jgi:bacterioferritin (cytochrome b1)